jgi:hypothetical protein
MISKGTFALMLAAAFSPLLAWPLDSVLDRGDSCLQVTWTPDERNTDPAWYIAYGSKCSGVDSIYRHSDFLPGVEYRGIAYSYGGEDPWYLFRSRVEGGDLVGSHLCHYNSFGDPTPMVTGTDCSGFLCFVWDVGRVSTSAMVSSSYYRKIALSDLQPGDALVRSGYHAVLVVDATDMTEALIWEATSAVNSCRERITDLTAAAWNLYTPLRNPALETLVRPYADNTRNPLSSSLVSMRSVRDQLCIRSETSEPVTLRLYSLRGELVETATLAPFGHYVSSARHATLIATATTAATNAVYRLVQP